MKPLSGEKLEKELYLIHERHAGERRLGILPEHYAVREIYREDYHVSQSDRECQSKKCLIKFRITYKFHVPYLEMTQPQVRMAYASPRSALA